MRGIITSKITSGDEIFMDIEEGAQELTVQIHKAGAYKSLNLLLKTIQ
jgi:hypothetical protein